MTLPKNLQEKRDELSLGRAENFWGERDSLEQEEQNSFDDIVKHYKSGWNDCANLLLPEIEKMVELLEDSLEVRNFESPEDAEVKVLGERIGFGALLSAAVKGWHKSAKEKEYPYEGVNTVGHCYGTIQSAIQSLREFLGEESEGGNE